MEKNKKIMFDNLNIEEMQDINGGIFGIIMGAVIGGMIWDLVGHTSETVNKIQQGANRADSDFSNAFG